MNHKLIRRAYDVAAELLECDMDDVELPSDLSEAEESEMREFIRKDVVAWIRTRGNQ